MAKYRKKPVIIEAFKYDFDSVPTWFNNALTNDHIRAFIGSDRKETQDWYCMIRTLEGQMRGDLGDFIIQGVNGEIYPCKPDIFEKTYEKVDEE